MKRTAAVVTVFAFASVAACKGGLAVQDEKLVPDAAKLMVHVDVKSMAKTKLFEDVKTGVNQDKDAKETVEAAKECNLTPEGLQSVTIGVDAASASNSWIVIVSGAGLGDEAKLSCIAGKVKEKRGNAPFEIQEKDGKKVLSLEGGHVGYIVDADTVALASSGWAGAVRDRIDGKGVSAIEGGLKDLVARADRSRHVWFAGLLPEDVKSSLSSTPASGIKDVSGSVDLTSGLAIWLAAGTESAERAKALHDEAKQQFDNIKGMAPMVGIPQGVVDSVKFGTKDATVTMEVAMSEPDLEVIKDKVAPMVNQNHGAADVGADDGEPAVPGAPEGAVPAAPVPGQPTTPNPGAGVPVAPEGALPK